MPGQNDGSHGPKFRFGPQWILFLIVIGMLTFSTLAFIRPIFQGTVEITPSPTALPATEDQNVEDGTSTAVSTPTDQTPPTPEEIGFTDGIILGSTILVLILLAGTLRETMRREGR